MKKTLTTLRGKAVVSLLGIAVFALATSGVFLRAQVDPDRQLYDDPIAFQQLSSGGQTRLILKFGPQTTVPATSTFKLPYNFVIQQAPINIQLAPTDPPPANVLVNDPALDLTARDTQSETSLVLGSGPNIVVGYNDSGSFGAANHFTGYSLSTDAGATFIDKGTLPVSPNGDVGDPVLARDTLTGTIYLTTLMFSGSGMQCFRSFDNGVTFTAPVN